MTGRINTMDVDSFYRFRKKYSAARIGGFYDLPDKTYKRATRTLSNNDRKRYTEMVGKLMMSFPKGAL